jgi:RNA polymerase sigma-70 factor (ECF subfamily)
MDHPTQVDAAAGALPSERSDGGLIAAMPPRDAQALGLLYDRYGVLMYTIAFRSTGDRTVAEAVVVEVFQVVWQSAGGCPVDGNVTVWMIGIARRRAIDALRARGGHSAIHPFAPDETGVVSMHERTARSTACDTLRALPAEQRTVIELAYYGGLTRIDIAARLNQSLSKMKTCLRQGLITLREWLRSSAEDLG